MTPEERATKVAQLAKLKKAKELQRIKGLRTSGQSSYDSMSNTGKFGVGVAKGAINTWYGLRDLFGDTLTREEQDTLEQLAGTQGGWATTGEVAGDLATFALPAAKLGELMVGLGKYAPKLLAKLTPAFAKRAAPFIADLGLNVGAEYAKAPTMGTTREDRAKNAAIGQLVTAGGMKLLGGLKDKISKGLITPTAAAQEMMDKGVRLTPAQASDSRVLEYVENLLEVAPIAGSNVSKLKSENLSDWNKYMMNVPEINPIPSNVIENVGKKGFDDLQGNFNKAYSDVWAQADPKKMDWDNINASFTEAMKKADLVEGGNVKPVKELLKNTYRDLFKFRSQNNPKLLESADKLITSNRNLDYSSQQLLKSVRDNVRDNMPNNAGSRLKEIDENYANYSVLQRGGSYVDSLKNDNIVTPNNLMGAVKAKSDERKLTRGEGLLQDKASEGLEILGNTRPQNRVLGKTLGGLGSAGAIWSNPLPAVAGLTATLPMTTRGFSEGVIKGFNPEFSKTKALANALRDGADNVLNKVPESIRKPVSTPIPFTPDMPNMTMEELNKMLMRSGAYLGGSDDAS